MKGKRVKVIQKLSVYRTRSARHVSQITEGVMHMFCQLPNKIPTIKICTSNRVLYINIQSL